MATKPEPSTVLGYTAQVAGTGTYSFTHTINGVTVIPHGNPHPADKRPGFLNVGEPGGIHPVIQGGKNGASIEHIISPAGGKGSS